MPLTAAEKQRRYRERRKLNKEKVEDNKEKDRERYHRNKKLVNELTGREKRLKRRKWRQVKQKQRKALKMLNTVIDNTPPSSPSGLHQNNAVRDRKKVRRERSEVHRKNIRLEAENIKLKKKVDKYRKQASRARCRIVEKKECLSPRSKTGEMLKKCLPNVRDSPGLKIVAKNLLKYHTLTKTLKNRYAELRLKSQKEGLRSILQHKIIRKYKIKMNLASDVLNLSRVRKATKTTKLNPQLEAMQLFYVRDDVSRATAGKKETRTKFKQKIQKRYLLDTLQNLYKKYKSEGGCYSYSYFSANRPFYIVPPTVESRDTCACKIHVNFEFKLLALKKINALQAKNIDEVLKQVVCDTNDKSCMYNECKSCDNKCFTLNLQDELEMSWSEWVRKEERYKKK